MRSVFVAILPSAGRACRAPEHGEVRGKRNWKGVEKRATWSLGETRERGGGARPRGGRSTELLVRREARGAHRDGPPATERRHAAKTLGTCPQKDGRCG